MKYLILLVLVVLSTGCKEATDKTITQKMYAICGDDNVSYFNKEEHKNYLHVKVICKNGYSYESTGKYEQGTK